MKEEQLKEYKAHLRKMQEMAKEIGIGFMYLDNEGNTVVSGGFPSILENLIIANMCCQDVFAKAIINAVSFFSLHQENISHCVSKMREQDALNEAKKRG